MSDYHDTVKCTECGSNDLKAIAPLRLHFQPHVKCRACDHEELEVLVFMKWDSDVALQMKKELEESCS